MERIFLDANVLFSAAWRENSAQRVLWTLQGVTIVTSLYAAAEAHRNLPDDERRSRLIDLLRDTLLVEEQDTSVPADIVLPEKDRPILAAAITAQCDALLTGDRRDFGPLLGKSVAGVLILTPRAYLESRRPGDEP